VVFDEEEKKVMGLEKQLEQLLREQDKQSKTVNSLLLYIILHYFQSGICNFAAGLKRF